MVAEIANDNVTDTLEHAGRFFTLLRHTMTLIQLQHTFHAYAPLNEYVEAVRAAWRTKSEGASEADKLLRDWIKVGVKSGAKVTEFLLDDVSEKSFQRKGKLLSPEIAEVAQKRGLKPHEIQMANRIWAFLEASLQSLRMAHIEEAAKLFGPIAQPIIDQINKEYDVMADRNYFPTARFGKYRILVRVKEPLSYKGQSYKTGETA